MADGVIGRREFYLTGALILLLLLVFYVLTPPPRPALSEGSLDQSWETALVEQFLRHAQCGTDLVFTYGPWGFLAEPRGNPAIYPDRKSTRLNSSHLGISYAVFCLKKKKYDDTYTSSAG